LTRFALDEFRQSALYHKKETYELLLSGFVLGAATIIEAVIYKDRPKVSLHDSYKAIGFGYPVADAILSLRECHPKLRLSYSVPSIRNHQLRCGRTVPHAANRSIAC
jgi:hypothetical protein